MPTLKNPRHERFAQELAAGKPAIEAHKRAGYKPDKGTASRLQHAANISQRVDEILAEHAATHAKGIEKAVERIAITKADVIQMLLDDRDLARATDQPSAAIAAAKLIGVELHRMFIERRESGKPGEFANEMTEAELATIARRGGNGTAATDTGAPEPSKLH